MVNQVLRDWVALHAKFSPGWPWPEESFGMDPVYGADGWCRDCGTPNRPQTGSLILQGSGFPKAAVFVCNWQFFLCLNDDTATRVAERFDVDFMPVRKPRVAETGYQQLIPRVTEAEWYDQRTLKRAIRADQKQRGNHERWSAKTCQSCARLRWYPVQDHLLSIREEALDGGDFLASPEIFGDGWSTFHNELCRRDLGELLVAASPRMFELAEIEAA